MIFQMPVNVSTEKLSVLSKSGSQWAKPKLSPMFAHFCALIKKRVGISKYLWLFKTGDSLRFCQSFDRVSKSDQFFPIDHTSILPCLDPLSPDYSGTHALKFFWISTQNIIRENWTQPTKRSVKVCQSRYKIGCMDGSPTNSQIKKVLNQRYRFLIIFLRDRIHSLI